MITASNVKTDSRQVDVGDVAVTTFMFSKQTSPRGRLLICGSLNQFCRIVNSQSVSACVETVACLSTCDGFFHKIEPHEGICGASGIHAAIVLNAAPMRFVR